MSAPPSTDSRFRDTINVPIAIPAWGALVLIAGAIYTAGTMVNKMDTLIDSSRRADDSIAAIREKQIGGLAAIRALEAQAARAESVAVQHDGRISAIERGERRK